MGGSVLESESTSNLPPRRLTSIIFHDTVFSRDGCFEENHG